MLNSLISNRTKTDNQITTDTLNNNILKTIASSNAKMRDPQEKENRNKKSGRHICIIGDSMVRHTTGPGISKKDQAQVKTYQGATTEDIIDYIKPTIRQQPDIVIIHSGTNDLTKDVNTMSRVRKVVAAVKEIDTEGKIKLGFSRIVARGDINKE